MMGFDLLGGFMFIFGAVIDPKALKRYGKRFFVMDKKRLVFFALRDRGVSAAREIDAARRSRRS